MGKNYLQTKTGKDHAEFLQPPKGQKCGCYVKYPNVKGKESIVKSEIVYCPLHANAPRLLDALEYCFIGVTNPNKRKEFEALLREC